MSVTLEKKENRIDIILDTPPVNVLNIQDLKELKKALETVSQLPPCPVALRAQGRFFCAGLAIEDHFPDKVEGMLNAFGEVFIAMAHIPGPLVALVQGSALGGGLELALFCDMVWASAKAGLGQPEIKVGAWPPIANVMLPRLIGSQGALDLTLSGRTVKGEEAQRIGLVQRLFPQEEFAESVEQSLDEMAALSGSVSASAKGALWGDRKTLLKEIIHQNKRYMTTLAPLTDYSEGLKAFVEKRPAKWRNC